MAHNFDITNCLSVDSKGIDEQAKRYKNMNCANNAASKIKLVNQERDAEPGRGMSAHHIEKFGIAREENKVIQDQFTRKNLMESFTIAEKMAVRSINTPEETIHWYRIMDEYAREISPSLVQPTTVVPNIPPSKVPSVRSTPATETIHQTHTTTSKLKSVVKKLYVPKDLETISENIIVLTQESQEPERQRMIPITVNRERIVKEIKEREKRDKEERESRNTQDSQEEIEILAPDPDEIKTNIIKYRAPRDTLSISEREERDREDDEYLEEERKRRDIVYNNCAVRHFGTSSSTTSKVKTRGETKNAISKLV